MVSTHVRILEVSAFHEPDKDDPPLPARAAEAARASAESPGASARRRPGPLLPPREEREIFRFAFASPAFYGAPEPGDVWKANASRFWKGVGARDWPAAISRP